MEPKLCPKTGKNTIPNRDQNETCFWLHREVFWEAKFCAIYRTVIIFKVFGHSQKLWTSVQNGNQNASKTWTKRAPKREQKWHIKWSGKSDPPGRVLERKWSPKRTPQLTKHIKKTNPDIGLKNDNFFVNCAQTPRLPLIYINVDKLKKSNIIDHII